MRKAVYILTLLIYFGINNSSAQTAQLDNLKISYHQNNAIVEKRNALMKICEQYFSLSADSLEFYVNLGLSLSDKNTPEYFRFKNFYCFYYLKNSKTTEANKYLDSLLQVVPALKNHEAVRNEIMYHKTVALIRDNQYKVAIENGLKFLEAVEKLKDTLSILKAYNSLGWANMELESEAEAVHWLSKGLKYTSNKEHLKVANSLYLNIASCYKVSEKFDSALIYINQGLQYSYDVENLTSQANALNIRASIYSKTKKIKSAEKDLEDALIIRRKIGDLHYIVSDMGQLAHYYAFIHKPQKGIAIALEGIELAKKSKNIYKLIYLKKGLANNYEAANQMKEYAATLVDVIQLKDSLYENNTEGAIAELGAKYELQKKENIIIQQENKLIRTQYFTFGSLIAFLLASIIIWLMYRNYKHVQERKMEQALVNEKLLSVKAVQQAEEKERKRIAADLHDNLGSYAAAITSNIRYLKENNENENKAIIDQLDENAKGIVTQLSDSIWVLKNEQLSITKLADRFKSWTQRIIQNYPQVKYFYEEDITNDIEFTPAKILNIFLILKECLNNSLKHSACNEIRIKFTSNETISIIIEDNGKGFHSDEMNKGNGIENIKYRAKECGLLVSWESLANAGTKVILKSY